MVVTRNEVPGAASAGKAAGPPVDAGGGRQDVREALVGLAEMAVTAVGAPVLRWRYNRWGASPEELAMPLPGDELVPRPKMTSTRAVTVLVPPEDVWPWVAQIGHGRAGFYSFDSLENLVGWDIHSADRILTDLPPVQVGDLVRLAPPEAPCYRVVRADAPAAFVLAGADPRTGEALPVPRSPEELAMTWQWVLRPIGGGVWTRLVSRQRYSYPRRQSALWHVVEPVDFVMERRMLLGITARAEAGTPTGRPGR